MMLAIHGAAGGWDELAIALVAFGVMWIAVKLAGRKAVDEDDEDEADAPESGVVAAAPQKQPTGAAPPAPPPG